MTRTDYRRRAKIVRAARRRAARGATAPMVMDMSDVAIAEMADVDVDYVDVVAASYQTRWGLK